MRNQFFKVLCMHSYQQNFQVTTFSQQAFDKLASSLTFWQQNLKIYAYKENLTPRLPP